MYWIFLVIKAVLDSKVVQVSELPTKIEIEEDGDLSTLVAVPYTIEFLLYGYILIWIHHVVVLLSF